MTVTTFEDDLVEGTAFMSAGMGHTLHTAHCIHQILVTLAGSQHMGATLTCSSDLAPCAKSAQASGQGKCRLVSYLLGPAWKSGKSLLQTSSLEAGR